jgi:hypothetical protein
MSIVAVERSFAECRNAKVRCCTPGVSSLAIFDRPSGVASRSCRELPSFRKGIGNEHAFDAELNRNQLQVTEKVKHNNMTECSLCLCRHLTSV